MAVLMAGVRAARARALVHEETTMRVEYDTEAGAAVVSGLERDEPIFVVRARDAMALSFLAFYSSLASFGELFDAVRAEQLAGDVHAFVDWRRKHADRVRDPD